MTGVGVSVQVLSNVATIPVAANPGDAGFDLHSAEKVYIQPGATQLVGTGLALEIPDGTVALVCSRSGLALHKALFVLNAPGVVDSGYRGEIRVILHNIGTEKVLVEVGDRIAQMMFQTYLTPTFTVVDELGCSVRGEGGFGSSGVAQA
jgi:dUTP pyrophosphatase